VRPAATTKARVPAGRLQQGRRQDKAELPHSVQEVPIPQAVVDAFGCPDCMATVAIPVVNLYHDSTCIRVRVPHGR
jgi:hypothetical protein